MWLLGCLKVEKRQTTPYSFSKITFLISFCCRLDCYELVWVTWGIIYIRVPAPVSPWVSAFDCDGVIVYLLTSFICKRRLNVWAKVCNYVTLSYVQKCAIRNKDLEFVLMYQFLNFPTNHGMVSLLRVVLACRVY